MKLSSVLVSAFIALVLFPMSVSAQEMDHSKMQMPMPAKDAEPAKKSATPEPMDHSKMDMEEMDHSKMGHDQAAEVDVMEGMDHSNMGEMKGMGQAPKEPITPIPVLTDADRAAAVPPDHGHMIHADTMQRFVLFNRLEAWDADPGTGLAWEGQAWFGSDLNRLWLRSEGVRAGGKT